MNAKRIVLLGLDFGSTTSHAIVVSAEVAKNCVSGRMELTAPAVLYRSPPVFTPFVDEALDLAALSDCIDRWLSESTIDPADLAGGGAIVTGLAAAAGNAQGVRDLVHKRVSSALIATADDPHLEAWLAFQGNCDRLCQEHPERVFLNLDVGGGTTNLAVGRAGIVSATACKDIGARHIRFQPGTYRVIGVARPGAARLLRLGLADPRGRELQPAERQAFVASLIGDLEALAAGYDPGAATITFSGGVGELVYRASAGQEPPGQTAYGDLGVELAEAILASPRLARDLRAFRPATLGRATVCGLVLHNVEVSGATIFLPDPGVLPLPDLPIVAALPYDAPIEALAAAFRLGAGSQRGFGMALVGMPPSAAPRTGQRVAAALALSPPAPSAPIVLLLDENGGKTVGHYATDWGLAPQPLLVLDEVAVPQALFVTLGRLTQSVVPVSFYGRKAT